MRPSGKTCCSRRPWRMQQTQGGWVVRAERPWGRLTPGRVPECQVLGLLLVHREGSLNARSRSYMATVLITRLPLSPTWTREAESQRGRQDGKCPMRTRGALASHHSLHSTGQGAGRTSGNPRPAVGSSGTGPAHLREPRWPPSQLGCVQNERNVN